MHDCNKLRDEIWEAVEAGEMPGDMLFRLGDCKSCRSELALAESAMQGFDVIRAVDAPDCSSSVMAKIDNTTGRGRAVWTYALAFVLLLAVVTVTAVMYKPKDVQPEKSMANSSPHRSVAPPIEREKNAVTRDVVKVEQQSHTEEKQIKVVHHRRKAPLRLEPRPVVKDEAPLHAEVPIQKRPDTYEQTETVVNPPKQVESKIVIIVMEEPADQIEQSGEVLDYGYTQTNPTTGDVTQCSVKKSGESVEIYMKIEPGNKRIPGEGRLDHEGENNV